MIMDTRTKLRFRCCYSVCLFSSVALNIIFFSLLLATPITNTPLLSYLPANLALFKTIHHHHQNKLTWSVEAAAKAEAFAAISCSGHGRAYLDGPLVDNFDDDQEPVCECNRCYGGPDCSLFQPDCAADVDSGDPLFLEPFWKQNAATSAVLISGWHRMSYSFYDGSSLSPQLEDDIRRVHAIARNAVTKGKYILFGGGSTQLLGAAVYALSMNLSSPASVVAAAPAYPLYKSQTDFFENMHFEYKGDVSTLNNSTDNTRTVIEFVTSPNNPDGSLRKAVTQGSSIYDHAYYWPHFTAIPSPANEDIMIFTISKLTGHAGSRFGWAFVKDEGVYQRMSQYISLAEMGLSREAQLRALSLMKTILKGNGTAIFEFAHQKMLHRWQKLSQTISLSKRFTLQEIPPQFCNFFEKVRGPSPAYAWLKCEREEDTDCYAVLRAANIIGRAGNVFNVEDRHVRLSLLKSDDDFNLMIVRLYELVTNEDGAKTL